MAPTLPATLDSAALSRRLGELAGHERAIQVEFLGAQGGPGGGAARSVAA